MKNKLFPILLCLLLVLSVVPSAMAATLDAAALTISGNTVTIDAKNDAALAALDSQGKTVKIAVPYAQAEVHVLKDNTTVVPHNWDKAGYIQFAVPGAGTYVITAGAPATIEEQFSQLSDEKKDIVLISDMNTLTKDHTLVDGTVIHANGNTIQGAGDGKTLKAEGSLQIDSINGVEAIHLGAGDQITFDAEGEATVVPSQNNSVGYGSVQITQLIDGKEVTQTYFLVKGEKLTVSKDGDISGNFVFAPGSKDATIPTYELQYEDHDNSHVKGKSGKLVICCNGPLDYCTKVTITPPDGGADQKLVEKVDGKHVTVPGVKIESGSTYLTLKSSYLNTLHAGTYMLTFHYADGATATEPLKIIKQAAVPDRTNPKTGDPISLAYMTMSGTAGMLAAAWLYKRKILA